MLWYSLEVPRWGTSNEYHNISFHREKYQYMYLLVEKSAFSRVMIYAFVCLFVLRFYGPVNPMGFKKGSCQFLAKECAQYWLTT